MHYEMLKILNKISKQQPVDVGLWSSTYKGIVLNWNFVLEDAWIEQISNEEVKGKLLEAITIFKNHK